MENAFPTPTNEEISRSLRPLFPLFADVVRTALERVHLGVPNLGLPRAVERANDMHRAIRECIRPICEMCPDWMELVEEPEGLGMDYIAFNRNFSQIPLALRWGRCKNGKISRNGTERSTATLSTGLLFDAGIDVLRDGLPMVTLAHTIEDDFTEIGVPQWYIGRVFLARESIDASERIEDVAVFSRPHREIPRDYEAPLIRSRQLDTLRWGDMISRLRAG
jgi:hypothetical protein